MNEPVNKVKEWLKVNYQKHIINYKKTKEFEDKFIEGKIIRITNLELETNLTIVILYSTKKLVQFI